MPWGPRLPGFCLSSDGWLPSAFTRLPCGLGVAFEGPGPEILPSTFTIPCAANLCLFFLFFFYLSCPQCIHFISVFIKPAFSAMDYTLCLFSVSLVAAPRTLVLGIEFVFLFF